MLLILIVLLSIHHPILGAAALAAWILLRG